MKCQFREDECSARKYICESCEIPRKMYPNIQFYGTNPRVKEEKK